ncbi:hypothetical protein Tsubulata_034239 [Turnera subulata]|uniref:DUF4283 domain-containing protein n=1 Tax=Turnera subulata TaxID=218843 RepID=A0A9Q0FFK8_9ROSI|nr:hypothetical protein Tsubulata_034239 [Turnera subulata]
MAPSSLYDVAGLVCEKYSLVMDLGKLVLPNPNSSVAQKLKAKSIVSFQQPVSVAMDNPVTVTSQSKAGVFMQLASISMSNSVVSALLVSTSSEPLGFSASVRNSVPLSFMKPIFNNDCSTLYIPPELLEIGRKKYQLCLNGQFMGTTPKLGLIHATLNKLWGRDGPIFISSYQDGLFLFQFPNEATYKRALSRGPWHIGGVPLMLWPWTSSSKKMDLTTTILPVWVKLKHVPLELLMKEGLSYLASTLGTPLHTDQDCSKIFKSDCANVCVKVDFSKPLLKELKLDINGENVIINVAYSWKPSLYDICKNYGHHALACNTKRIEKKWVQKTTLVVPVPGISNADGESSLNAFLDVPITDTKLSPIATLDASSNIRDTTSKNPECHVTDDLASYED